jgi:hypothetical protein
MDHVRQSIRSAGATLWSDLIGVTALTVSFFCLLHISAML